jgi:integrase
VIEEIVVHNYKKIFQQTLDRIRADPKLTENNKTDIIKFSDNCFSEGLKVSGTLKYLIRLRQLAKMLKKDFRTCDKSDLVKLMEFVEKGNFTNWTKHDYKVVLKKFYRWLRDTEDYPEEVKWINSSIRNVNNRLPEELLTEEEVLKLIKATSYPRDKVLISVLYESGCRIGEVLSLRMKHVQFDEYGCQIIVNGKTGQRRVRLIASAPYLNNWINLHPFNDNPE